MTKKSSNKIVDWTAKELSEKIHNKTVSCNEVMKAYLEQINKINPKVNAIVSLQDEKDLLKQADEKDALLAKGKSSGWMHGFPAAPKDMSGVKGIVSTQGCLVFKDFVPDADSLNAERMRKNGAIFIGKTNTPEFGFGSQTYNKVYGTTSNAYDTTKAAGGSSGGAAVSLATHMLPVADGSDMMGSLRNPAAYNNVIGFRPSQGRVPMYPSTDVFVRQLGYNGPMGRNVEDTAMLLSVQAGWDRRSPLTIKEDPSIFTKPLNKDLKGVKIGWIGDWNGYLPIENGIIELCEKGLNVLKDKGCEIESVIPDYSPHLMWDTWMICRHFQTATNMRAMYNDPAKRNLLKPETIWEIESGLNLTAERVGKAFQERSNIYMSALRLFDKYDYLIMPSAQVFPFDKEIHWPKTIKGVPMDTYHRWMEIVLFASLIASPAINVPVGFGGKENLPMGMQIIAGPTEDFEALRIAYEYEQATEWTTKYQSPLLK